jgi:hypothetical protein
MCLWVKVRVRMVKKMRVTRMKMMRNKIVLSSDHSYNESITFAIRKNHGKFRS